MEPLFRLGSVVVTCNAEAVLPPSMVLQILERHAKGDWGELDAEDLALNEKALREGLRLFSRYTDGNGRVVYVITEADRACTTILLAGDY